MVDGEVYKRIRILAIERNMEVSALIEEAMREKLEREYPQYHQQSQPQQEYKRDIHHYKPENSTDKNRTQQQQQQQQERSQEQKSGLLSEHTITPSIDEIIETGYPMLLPTTRIEFPINKRGLIQIVKDFLNEFNEKYKKTPLYVEHELFIMENLPDAKKMYKDNISLNYDLDMVVNNKKVSEKIFGKPERIHGCNLILLDEERKITGCRE